MTWLGKLGASVLIFFNSLVGYFGVHQAPAAPMPAPKQAAVAPKENIPVDARTADVLLPIDSNTYSDRKTISFGFQIDSGEVPLKQGDTIYLSLYEQDGVWTYKTATGWSTTTPSIMPYVRGVVSLSPGLSKCCGGYLADVSTDIQIPASVPEKNMGVKGLLVARVRLNTVGHGEVLDVENIPVSPAAISLPSDWKTFADQEYGFSISYPSNYSVNLNNGNFLIQITALGGADADHYSIQRDYVQGNSLVQISNALSSAGLNPLEENIGGIIGLLVNNPNTGIAGVTEFHFMTSKGPLVYMEPLGNQTSQILASLRKE